jgi:hypothetical protein
MPEIRISTRILSQHYEYAPYDNALFILTAPISSAITMKHNELEATIEAIKKN